MNMSTREPVPARSSQLGSVLQVIAVVGAVILALWTLHRIASVVLVLIAGALFAYVMAPLVQLAECPIRLGGQARRLPRAAAIGVVYLLVAVGICAGAMILLPIASRQAAEAVRSRIDWKYLLGLELTDPGFDASVL